MFWLPTLVVLLWCVLGVRIVRSLRSTTVLRANQPSSPLESFPRVSIIVAARNEEEALPAALESLLALDYPDFEVVLVDDDSQDHTGAIADEWASKPAARGRLKVLHNKTLPPRWHGKVHALHLASSAVSGEWILATDADMVLHPSVLSVAVSFALERGVQFLSIIPELEFGSFWEKVVLPGFSFLITALFPVHLVNDPASPRALAAGAFILMKRHDLVALGGYARLRNVLIEDLRMAELFKRHGRRIYLAASRGLLHTRMYTSGAEMFLGLSRIAFEGSGYSIPKTLGAMFLANLLAVFPWVALITRVLADWKLDRAELHDPFLLVAVVACLIASLVYLPFILHSRIPPLYVLTLPLAALFYSCVSVYSILTSRIGRGVSWKDRRYRAPVE
ncbi:MAG: glycosyltransferase family 2 protein [Terriglobia bacterium]|jgi:chlorobactene glucosyltransferase